MAESIPSKVPPSLMTSDAIDLELHMGGVDEDRRKSLVAERKERQELAAQAKPAAQGGSDYYKSLLQNLEGVPPQARGPAAQPRRPQQPNPYMDNTIHRLVETVVRLEGAVRDIERELARRSERLMWLGIGLAIAVLCFAGGFLLSNMSP